MCFFYFCAENQWRECFKDRARAFEKARRVITRDPRAGKGTEKEHEKKTEKLKPRYFLPAMWVADNWMQSKGGQDHTVAARMEQLKIRLAQLKTDFLNQRLARARLREGAKGAGPPPSDTESDDSTDMPPLPKKQTERAPLKLVVAVMPRQNQREKSEERTSDGRGARQRSFFPVRGTVYVNSNVRREETWAEKENHERQQRGEQSNFWSANPAMQRNNEERSIEHQPAPANRPRFAFAWNGKDRHACICCGDKVWVGKCARFISMSLRQRRQVIAENQVCENCFRCSHQTDRCRKANGAQAQGCWDCNGEFHNSLLCPRRNK